MLDLNKVELCQCYIDWRKMNCDGRNKDGLRFGQWLVNTYGINAPYPDIYCVESPKVAFDRVYSALSQ